MSNKDYSLYNYRNSIPTILKYQVVSKAVFAIAMLFYRWITGFLLWNLGRPAVTSGDIPYLMRSWQGWLLILSGFLALVLYTIFDINAMILISSKIIHNQKVKPLPIIRDAARKARHFKTPLGVLIILYVSLIAPLTGVSLGITLTSNFAIPDFIMSFINDRFILKLLYNVVLFALGFAGFIYIFTFHFILIGDLDVKSAMKHSSEIVKKNWKNFIRTYLAFVIRAVLWFLAIVAVVFLIPIAVIHRMQLDEFAVHTATIFVCFISYGVILLFGLLSMYFMMMKLTLIYERYTGYDNTQYSASDRESKKFLVFTGIPAVAVIALLSLLCASAFDSIFPNTSNVKVIAHRAGGDLAHENTILGLEAAIEHEAEASEIDMQRTSDGYYVINHDDTFERPCGDPRASYEMTLDEVRELRVEYALDPTQPPTNVATIEEFLDGSKGRIKLLVELKGATADREMADDLYQMVKERDMIDDVMFIGLNYDLIDYVETTYPEITTGYLCFFGFGQIQNMNCDVLLLEAETATLPNVNKVHQAGKKVGVWTVDSVSAMLSFMLSDADYIITDKVAETDVMKDYIANMNDETRILQKFLP